MATSTCLDSCSQTLTLGTVLVILEPLIVQNVMVRVLESVDHWNQPECSWSMESLQDVHDWPKSDISELRDDSVAHMKKWNASIKVL